MSEVKPCLLPENDWAVGRNKPVRAIARTGVSGKHRSVTEFVTRHSRLIHLIMTTHIDQNNFLFGDNHFQGYPIADVDRYRMQSRQLAF